MPDIDPLRVVLDTGKVVEDENVIIIWSTVESAKSIFPELEIEEGMPLVEIHYREPSKQVLLMFCCTKEAALSKISQAEK